MGLLLEISKILSHREVESGPFSPLSTVIAAEASLMGQVSFSLFPPPQLWVLSNKTEFSLSFLSTNMLPQVILKILSLSLSLSDPDVILCG